MKKSINLGDNISRSALLRYVARRQRELIRQMTLGEAVPSPAHPSQSTQAVLREAEEGLKLTETTIREIGHPAEEEADSAPQTVDGDTPAWVEAQEPAPEEEPEGGKPTESETDGPVEEESTPILTPHEAPNGKTILVVDDDDAVREIMAEVLLTEGYRVIPTANGREALRIAAGISVDLIITDLMMPEMNGWRLLARLRDLDLDIPVVLITGYMNREGHEILTNNEIAGFLAKPVELEKLVRMANRVVFPEAPHVGRRVLVVDSDAEARERISAELQAAGFEVEAAAEGQEALDKVEEFGPNLVLLDVVLPMVDGLEVCRRLRSAPSTAEIPVILLTDQSSPETVQQALALKVDGFIVKPFEPEDLIGRIHRALLHARADT